METLRKFISSRKHDIIFKQQYVKNAQKKRLFLIDKETGFETLFEKLEQTSL